MEGREVPSGRESEGKTQRRGRAHRYQRREMLRWAARRLLTHSKRAILIEWCGPKPAPPCSAQMSRSGAKGKCCS